MSFKKPLPILPRWKRIRTNTILPLKHPLNGRVRAPPTLLKGD